MAIVLTEYFAKSLSKRCSHLAGNRGAKAAVREVVAEIANHKFVFRTDVKSYYASIGHDVLLRQLERHFRDQRLLHLFWQYLHRTVYDGGFYEDIKQGISLGCPLSPLMGALFLDVLDSRMEATGLFYVRFMDDWVVLAPTRWKLQKAIRLVNQTLAELKVEQHPDKTFIGRISKGFSFLGYQINHTGLTDIAPLTKQKHAEHIHKLNEQGASEDCIGEYVRRWWIWVKSGVSELMNLCWTSLVSSIQQAQALPIPNTKMH